MNEEEVELDKARKEVFHHIVAKLLFVAKRVKPDIDLTIYHSCALELIRAQRRTGENSNGCYTTLLGQWTMKG